MNTYVDKRLQMMYTISNQGGKARKGKGTDMDKCVFAAMGAVFLFRGLGGLLLALAAVKLCREEDRQKAAGPWGTCGKSAAIKYESLQGSRAKAEKDRQK